MRSPRHHGKVGPANPPARHAARHRIVAGARWYFFAHGFRGVTMDDLARELGMSKKTIYASYPSKTALLEAVLLDKFRGVEADFRRIASDGSDVSAALHRLLACVQGHTDEIKPPFVRDIQREAPDMFRMVESRRQDLIQRYFGKLFVEGRRAGIIRKDIPVRLIIEMLLGATRAILNPPKMEELGLTPKTGFSAIITVMLHGALTERGRSAL